MALCVWLLSLGMFSRLVHVVRWCLRTSFLFTTEEYLTGCTTFEWPFSRWFGLLWIELLPRTFVSKFLCERMFSFLLGVYVRVKLLGDVVTLFLIEELPRLLPTATTPFYIPTCNVWGMISPQPHQHLSLSVFFINNHPSECEVVSHCGFHAFPW